MARIDQDFPLLRYHDHIVWWYFLQNQTITETRDSLLSTFPEVSAMGPNDLLTTTRDHELYPSIRTIARLLNNWGYHKNFTELELAADDALQERMRVLFYGFGLNDIEIAGFLRREGYYLSHNW